MIFINEWLPNPNGADTKGEFIELFNNGSAPVNLSGWTIGTTAKKVFTFGIQTIAARGYLVLSHAATKLSLKNTGETISLRDANRRLVDQSMYLGAAPSGQSFSRVLYSSSNAIAQPQGFAWGTPTPGTANKVDLHNNISNTNYPIGVPLNRSSMGGPAFLIATIFIGAILAVLVVYCLKSHEDLSKLFFGGNN